MVKRPNVVVVYADDLGWGDLGCFGSEHIPTPAMDDLCRSGVMLPQWYSNSPVCSPSRASLLTGLYPAHAGVEAILGGERQTRGLPVQATLASELADRGYRTGIFGKWHLGVAEEFGPLRFGFEEHFGFKAGCVDYYSHIYYWGPRNPVHDLWDDTEEVWRNGEYLTEVIAQEACRFIAENRDNDFFCYIPFNAPHYPMHAPERYMKRFSHLDEAEQTMAAMVAALDDAVGQIVSTLEELGLRDDTLIFMSSDNGPSRETRNWLNGEEVSYHGGSTGGLRGSKGSVLEGGIRVPTILSWPKGVPSGTTYDKVGVMMDLLPTVLEAVDGETGSAARVDGESLLGAIRGGAGPGERSVFWTYEGQWAVRRGPFKLVDAAREGMVPPVVVERALFDIENDPNETMDVSAAYPAVVEELEAELTEFRARHADWAMAGRAGPGFRDTS